MLGFAEGRAVGIWLGFLAWLVVALIGLAEGLTVGENV